MLIVWRNNLDL